MHIRRYLAIPLFTSTALLGLSHYADATPPSERKSQCSVYAVAAAIPACLSDVADNRSMQETLIRLAGPADRPDPDLLDKARHGDSVAEGRFITALHLAAGSPPPAPPNRFYDVSGERDGRALSLRLQTLGAIGTPRAMIAVCPYLRSPLKRYVSSAYERAVRFDALEALRNNYPNDSLLRDQDEATMWASAERFCKQIGVRLPGATPTFVKDRVYPHVGHSRATEVAR